MTPIDQRTKDDCERCCYAMVLGVPYEDVPDFFTIYKTTRRDERDEWLAKRGLCKFSVGFEGTSAHVLPKDSPLLIAGVASPTGHPDGHAVVGRIRNWTYETVYDPHPQREKSGTKPFDMTFFLPLP